MKWINVKESLPKDMEPVLVTAKNSDGTKYVTEARFNKNCYNYMEEYKKDHPNGVWEWPYESISDDWEEIKEEVTHWMPYPDPAE